jgi:hypothetical protein
MTEVAQQLRPYIESHGMTKAELAILGRVYEREVSAALSGGERLFQSRSKIAARLADEGFLERRSVTFGRGALAVTVKGYELTHAGRLAYCIFCDDEAA